MRLNQLDTTQPWEMTPEQQRRLQLDIAPVYQRQIERSAQAVHVQRIAENIVGAILRYNQSTEGKRAARQAATRKPTYASSGMITRSAGAYSPSHGGRVTQPGVHPRPTLQGRRACGCWLCAK